VVESTVQQDALVLTLAAPSTKIAAVHVRWQAQVTPGLRALGDAWERSYGELGWRDLIPERVMPWYLATHDGLMCHGYGVKTDAAALCFWQLDPEGVSLWLNVTNGGDGVELGQRRLTIATVVTRRGVDGGMEDEPRPAVFEPGMMTAIDLDEEAGLGHGLAAAPVAWRTPFPGTGQAVLAEEALDGRARDLDAFAVLECFGEVTVVEAGIGRTGQF